MMRSLVRPTLLVFEGTLFCAVGLIISARRGAFSAVEILDVSVWGLLASIRLPTLISLYYKTSLAAARSVTAGLVAGVVLCRVDNNHFWLIATVGALFCGVLTRLTRKRRGISGDPL